MNDQDGNQPKDRCAKARQEQEQEQDVTREAREGIRDAIADRLEGQAEWREAAAREHPNDERNLAAAEAMRATAQYVRELPDDDYRLVELDSLSVGISPFVFDGEVDHDDENRLWGQLAFNYIGSPSDHLDAIYTFYVEG